LEGGALMAQTQPWLRYYVEAPDDPKVKRIALITNCERIFVNGVWVAILAMAKASPVEGSLLIAKDTPADIAEIADMAGTNNIELLETVISGFVDLDMLEKDKNGVLTVSHWCERQYKSDSSTPRVQNFRQKKNGNVSGNEGGNVTPPSGGNVPESDTEQSQNRAETEASAPSDHFEEIQHAIEQITGILPDHGAPKAINEIIAMGAIPADIQAGYNWLKGQKKNVRYYNMLVGPTRTAMSRRVGENYQSKPPTAEELGLHYVGT
jgi:hypothetical protein